MSKETQARLEGMPGPTPEEAQKSAALESAVLDLHEIMAVMSRGLPKGTKITMSRAHHGATLNLTFSRGKE